MEVSPRLREAVTAGLKTGHVSMPNARGNIPLVVRLWRRASAVGQVATLSFQFQAWGTVVEDFACYQSIPQHLSVLNNPTFNMQFRSLAYKIELIK